MVMMVRRMVVLRMVLVVRVLMFALVSQAEMLQALMVSTRRHALIGWTRTWISRMVRWIVVVVVVVVDEVDRILWTVVWQLISDSIQFRFRFDFYTDNNTRFWFRFQIIKEDREIGVKGEKGRGIVDR